MSSAVSSSSVSEQEKGSINFAPIEDPYRQMLCEAIYEGLFDLKWAWRQGIPTTLRKDLDAEPGSITLALVKSIITEAEDKGIWAAGWAEAQLTEARAVQRIISPPSRYAFTARGQQIGNSKLTDQKVRAIRKQYAARYARLEQQKKTTIKNLAAQYEVNDMTIRRVIHRETWRHIP